MSAVIPPFVAFELPALSTPPGLDAGGRRAWVRGASDAELVDAIDAMVVALASVEPVAVAGLPAGEVFASPWGLRAIALSTGAGAWAAHHEVRHLIEWPDAFGDDEAVHDDAHGAWSRGVLEIGKYRSFLQDEPLTVYNPNHMAKWAPHELLHRAGAYFWREGASAWDLYLTARLNELVPVVTWYGVDQILRRDGGRFDRAAWAARPAAPLADATWRTATDRRARVERDASLLRRTVEHFDRELAAIDREIATWQQVATPQDGLDASSDAIAYVVGHATRLRDRATVRFMDRALVEGVHYDATVEAYRARVVRLFDEVVFGAIHVDAEVARTRATGRWLHDVLHRAASSGWDVFKRLVPVLDDARSALAAAADGTQSVDIDAWSDAIAGRLRDGAADRVLAVGSGEAVDRAQLVEGLESVVPRTTLALGLDDPGSDALTRFAVWPGHRARTRLVERLAAWLRVDGADPAHLELLRLEQTIAAADRRADDRVERLCVPADALPEAFEGVVVRNTAFAVHSFDVDVLALHADPTAALDDVATPTDLLVGCYRDGVSILPAPAAVRELWDALAERGMDVGDAWALLDAALDGGEVAPGLPADADTWLDELLAAGALGFIPTD